MRPRWDTSGDELAADRTRHGIETRGFVVGDPDHVAGAPKVLPIELHDGTPVPVEFVYP